MHVTTDVVPNTLTHQLLDPPFAYLAPRILVEHAKDGQLCCHCLATPSGCPEQHTVVCVEHRVEDLCLYGVKVVKGEQALILGVLQGSCG